MNFIRIFLVFNIALTSCNINKHKTQLSNDVIDCLDDTISIYNVYPKWDKTYSFKRKEPFSTSATDTSVNLELRDVDSIPEYFRQYGENVTSLFIYSGRSIFGISNFPNLQKLYLYNCKGSIPNEVNNLNIKLVLIENSSLNDVERLFKNKLIREFSINDSKVDDIPYAYINENTNLKRIQLINVESDETINLDKFNFKNHQCLSILNINHRDNKYKGEITNLPSMNQFRKFCVQGDNTHQVNCIEEH
jgi:hypothetical protein